MATGNSGGTNVDDDIRRFGIESGIDTPVAYTINRFDVVDPPIPAAIVFLPRRDKPIGPGWAAPPPL